MALVSGLCSRGAGDAGGGLASGESGRTQVSGGQRLQWVLVGGQVALSVTLLTGAGLLVRSFQALARVEPGFEKSGVLTFRVEAATGARKRTASACAGASRA